MQLRDHGPGTPSAAIVHGADCRPVARSNARVVGGAGSSGGLGKAVLNPAGPREGGLDVGADVLLTHNGREPRLLHDGARLFQGSAEDSDASRFLDPERDVLECPQPRCIDCRHVPESEDDNRRERVDLVGHAL